MLIRWQPQIIPILKPTLYFETLTPLTYFLSCGNILSVPRYTTDT